MNKFHEVGIRLQETSNSIAQAEERMNVSCTKCRLAATCIEHKCPIMQTHQRMKTYLSVQETGVFDNKRPTDFEVKTRKYTKSEKGEARRRILRAIARAYDIDWDRTTELIIDKGAVLVEMDMLEIAREHFRIAGLYMIANAIERELNKEGK